MRGKIDTLEKVPIKISPASRRKATEKLCRKLGLSERRACKALGQYRSTQRYRLKQLEKDKPLIKNMLTLLLKHPRFGYRSFLF